ncbi:unnamed protein product [Rotaria socialis]|uniref:Helix-turn-helix domain-containing protein n=1 Tax=Rotaria socialis TaxID=392032 RepID=A0A821VS85_9BILA|nr:unnamed protein product [Rotaria socialis]CAF4911909.1 unnamed protein product [Rotaria socialis]
MNTFYLGNRQDFERKAFDYLTKCDAWKCIITKANDTKDSKWRDEVKEIIETMNFLLETLKQRKFIQTDLYNRLIIDPKKVILPYADFLPDVSSKTNEIVVVPYIVLRNSPTWKIAKYITDLLQPVVDKTLKATTFHDDIDFIHKLNHYVHHDKHLKPTTLFCSIRIVNYYTLDLNKKLLDTVEYFLRDHVISNKLDQLSIQTVKNILYLYLDNNIFCYQDKIYRYEKGSPDTMPLSDILLDIYVFSWQNEIFNQIRRSKDLFGRSKDRIFFTWNQSNKIDLENFLQTIQDHRPNVQFESCIGMNVSFLNAYIENRQGQLFTRVYHHSNLQRYTLPYVLHHSEVEHSNWLRTALIRCVCLCTSIEDFHHERIYLDLTYLTNGYSLEFVESHMEHFFNFFHMSSMRFSNDQSMYDKFRNLLFGYMTKQHQRCDELQEMKNKGQVIQLNYRYEYGPRCEFNKIFHQLWLDYFKEHRSLSKNKINVLLTTRHLHSLNTLLTKEKLSLSSSSSSSSSFLEP